MTDPTTSRIPRIISVDDHVMEPGDLWSSRLPAKLRDRGPRLVREKGSIAEASFGKWTPGADGGIWADIWYYDDFVAPVSRMSAAAGLGELRWGTLVYDEILPGAWKPTERLADMDANHVDASICFPNTLPRFAGQTFSEHDRELGLLCVQAYNDWMIEEWCGGVGAGRLIPLTIVPLWDAELAAAEVRRCAAKGSHAVTFPESPFMLGFPTIHSGFWDPLFEAMAETESVLCMHIGSSSRMPQTSPDAPFIVSSTLTFQNVMGSLLDFIFSGTLARFPGLRLSYAEGQVGWMPYLLERADALWHERTENSFGTNGVILDQPPSAYARRQVWGCIFNDETGLANRDRIGMDRICFETDYPHADGTFPHTEAVVTKICAGAGLNDAEVLRLLRTNAIECFGLQRFGITE